MQEEQLFQTIAEDLQLNILQVRNTIELLDNNNTVPFISRYRKEKTGSLDEKQIRDIQEKIKYLRTLEARKETILQSVSEQGKLTKALEKEIRKAMKLQELEDLYLPYRPKKKTRASVARERGLEPLAQIMLSQEISSGDPIEIYQQFVNPQKDVADIEAACQGACDIVAEIISEQAGLRKIIRELTANHGYLTSSIRKKSESREFEMYSDFRQPFRNIPPYRILAINRGEKENVLNVDIEIERTLVLAPIKDEFIKSRQSIFYDELTRTAEDAYTRLIAPAINRELRGELTLMAENHAINVFSINLKNLLLQPPVKNKRLMGIDPGFRTGCKVAVIDESGKFLKGETIYPHPPQKKYFEAKSVLRELINDCQIDIVAIGNGTASRETELMVADLITEMKSEREFVYVIVSEAGASVYSASDLAREEFPDLEASLRGNISIARRLQDPLAELVKIDPRSIGVGLYQHDINQKALREALDDVIESCVNHVGVDLNTASKSLLMHISGLNKRNADKLVSYREKNGRFKNRQELNKVEGIGRNAFQQAAGFLRISDGENPLDATSIHPESYPLTERLLAQFEISDLRKEGRLLKQRLSAEKISLQDLAARLTCGLPTLEDILDNLEKPGRDPREEMPKPVFRSDVLKMEDLKEGMVLKGTVRNVVDFGAFVDIGVKQDGLIHISQMTKSFVKSPYELLQVGDVVDVKVLSVDTERGRIALSMKT